MNTPSLEKTIQGFFHWMKWKIAYILYLLCAVLPIALCLTCIMVLSISRRSTIVFPIIMSAMLHPVVMIPFGVFTKILEEYLLVKLFNRYCRFKLLKKILRRLFTYSINVHLSLLAGLIFYQYDIWNALESTSIIDFKNRPFNLCPCDALNEINEPCINKETENSFQNMFVGVSNTPFLISFLVTSIACHSIHALILTFPSPIPLSRFVIGDSSNQSDDSSTHQNKQPTNLKPGMARKNRLVLSFKLSCCFLVASYIAGILTTQFTAFDAFIDKGKQISTKYILQLLSLLNISKS